MHCQPVNHSILHIAIAACSGKHLFMKILIDLCSNVKPLWIVLKILYHALHLEPNDLQSLNLPIHMSMRCLQVHHKSSKV